MTLTPGTRFGPYEVVESIGAGGMGEVFRATDPSLKRDVALKVLPAAVAVDADRLARFQREAEVLAALNHANIAHIYGLEKAEGRHALVMELVEGPTLAERIAQGPLPLDEALAVAAQIADALDAAHARGIVHRDLKPANVKLRDDGTVKVLDFGIAKALDVRQTSGGPQFPSLTTPAMTAAGIVLGTAAYMSPEQARGRPVDKRADVWAFGCVLYEMLTGQPAFGGEDVTITLARVLERDTDFDALPESVPAVVRHTLALCLQKDVDRRIRDIGDVKLALAGRFETGELRARVTAAARQPLWRRAVPATVGLLVGGAVVGLAALALKSPEPARPVTRFADSGATLPQSFATISRDGTRVGFAAGTPRGIYVRRLDEFAARVVPGTEGRSAELPPCFSPDGEWIAFSTAGNRGMAKVPVGGGGTLPLAVDVPTADLCDWADDGYVYFGTNDGIMRVPETGGAVETVAAVAAGSGEVTLEAPQALPGGRALLYTIFTTAGLSVAEVAVQDLQTGERKIVLEGAGLARFMPTGPDPALGHLVYGIGGDMFAAPFDVERLEAGSPSPVLDSVSALGAFSFASVSDSGMLVYMTGDIVGTNPVPSWAARDGAVEPLPGPPRLFGELTLSPDRQRAAFGILDIENLAADLWVHEFEGGRLTRLTFDGASANAVWSPDGERLYYARAESIAGGDVELRVTPADNSGPPVTLLAGGDTRFLGPTSITPDGAVLIGTSTNPGGADGDVWALDLANVSAETPGTEASLTYLLDSSFDERHASLSPDGRWLAYTSNESGADEIYVVPYPGPGGRTQVSTDGGRQARWHPAGGELFYISSDRMMAADVQATEARFRAGTPRALFDKPGTFQESVGSLTGFHYDVAADGSRFLVLVPAGSGSELRELRYVLNWFEELRRLAPYPASWSR